MKRVIIIFLALSCVVTSHAATSQAKWLTSYEEALKESQKRNLPVLILYTAPSMCKYSKEMDKEILQTRSFREFADKNLVLLRVEVDLSNQSSWDSMIDENMLLIQKFPMRGFPETCLMAPTGEEIGRIEDYKSESNSSLDKVDWSAKTYIKKIKVLISSKTK